MNTKYLHRQFCALVNLIFIFLISLSSVEAQSLETVLQTALKNNLQVKAAAQELLAGRLESKAAFRETLPTLSIDASYNHVTDVPEIGLPFGLGSIKMGTYDRFESGISANYVLFSGFALQNKTNIKKQTAQMQQVGLTKAKKQTAFQVIASYRAVQSIMLQKDILRAAAQRLNLQLERARSLVDNGMILALDTLSLHIAILDYEKKTIEVSGNLKTSEQQLQNLVGEAVKVSAELPSAFMKKPPDWKSQEISDLKRMQIRRKIAESVSALAGSAFYPKIALQAAYRYGKPGLDAISNEWMQYGVWGVGLSWNIFHGRSDALKKEAALAQEKRIGYLQQATADHLKLEYDKSLNEYQFLIKQLNVSERSVKLAQEKMKIVKLQYEQGVATVTDFNFANLDLTEVQLERSGLLLQIALKFNEIEYKSGKPISEWSLAQ